MLKCSRGPTTIVTLLVLAVLLTAGVQAQTNVGQISGTVKDSTGGVLPGVEVTVTNEATGITRTTVTNDSGFFLTTNLPVGNYTVIAEMVGFKRAGKSGIALFADGRITADLVLHVGEMTQEIEVTAVAGETVNTVSGEIARVVDSKQVQNMALNGRNYMQLVSLIPGSVLLDEDQLNLTTSLSVTAQAVNGNRGNSNMLLVDGGSNLDSGSNGSQINNIGIDFIDQVKIQTSNFSAEYGRNSGAAINVVTRGGGNRFHGGAWEYARNDVFDARQTFRRVDDNGDGKYDASPLRFNNFGYNINGPIAKNKLFFFFGQEWKFIRRQTDPTRRTLPTRAERAGDFSARSGNLFLPGTTTPVPDRNVASMITPDGRAIAELYNQMEGLAGFYVDEPISNNAIFQGRNPFDWRQDIVRLDVPLSEKHSLFFRYLHDKYDLIEPFGTFINSQMPTIPTNRLRPGYSGQLSHTWTISPQLINEAKLNTAWNGQRIPPVGEYWKRSTYGFQFQELYAGGWWPEGIPQGNITGFASWRGPAAALLSPTTDITMSDNVTVIQNNHMIKTGVQVIRNRKDQNGRPDYNGNLNFNTSGNPNTTGNAFADALLGNFRTYTEASLDPIGMFRFTQVEAYVQDNWKVMPRLSLEIGLRYQYGLPIYVQGNNITNFDPSLYDPAQAMTVNQNGTLVPGSGNRYNGLIRAGDGVPGDHLGRVPLAESAAVKLVPGGAPRGLYEPEHLFAPRFSFALQPFQDSRTAIRGGIGLFYDRPEGNIIFSQVNVPPFFESAQFENGNLNNITGGSAAALAPWGGISALDPKLKSPYTISYSLSVQRELPFGLFAEVAGVSTLARHLLRQPDINQASFETLRENAAKPSAERLATNAMRPYKGFANINMRLSDSTSNYYALQSHVTKRKGNFTFTTSYTWSKVLADSSGNGDNPEDPFNRKFNYGPTSFDRRHAFVTYYSYAFPVFRNMQGVFGQILGGWEVSGITRAQTGQYLTPTGNTSIGGRRADVTGQAIDLPSDQRGVDGWFNRAAFTPAPDTRRGNAGVGIIQGPGLYLWDLTLRKRFLIREGTTLHFQTDFFNAFNNVNLRNPDTNFSSGNYGTIGSAGPARNIQFGLKLLF